MRRSVNVKAFICIAAVMGLVFAMGGCKGLGKSREVDLTQYVKTSFYGYDGDGCLEYSFDYDGLMDDLEDLNINFDEDDVEGAVSLKPNKTDELSNGDRIKFRINVKSRLEKRVKAVFVYDDFDVTVKGLDVRLDYDPFDYIDIVFSGISPNGKATIQNIGSSPVAGVNYRIGDGYGSMNFKNGDVITVTAFTSYSQGLEEYVNEEGYNLVTDIKEYTVSGLEEYIESLGRIDKELMDELAKQGEDVFYTNTYWGEDEKIDSVEYQGAYFAVLKDGVIADYDQNNNYLYMVYKITVTNPNETLTYFYYVRFADIVRKTDGTSEIYNINEVEIPYGSNFSGDTVRSEGEQSFFYVGYKDVTSFYNTIIRPLSQYYNFENNIT